MSTKLFLPLLFILPLPFVQPVEAQIDPVLAGMISTYTDKAEKQLKAQERAMLLEGTGHLWIREETDETTRIQRQFNNYLDSFRDIVCLAAQIYGFYHEIDCLATHLGDLTRQLERSPGNSLAVALTPRRNSLYREVILTSVDICNDIRLVCLSDTKMTEKERIEIVFAIRPKLKKMNRIVVALVRAVKYTSLWDVWDEIAEHAKEPADKAEIVKQAMRRWKRTGRNR